MAEHFDSLVDMQEVSCRLHAGRRLFGTKREGRFEWMTYADFATAVDAARGGLAAHGVGPGDRVAVISNNRVEWAISAYATYGLGAHWVPMYEAQPPSDWAYILADAKVKVVLCSTEEIHSKLLALKTDLPDLQHVFAFDAAESRPHAFAALRRRGAAQPSASVKPSRTDVASLLYTSGTTGKPKGVVLSHENFCTNVYASAAALPLASTDVSVSFLPWAHAFGQTGELHMFVSRGAAMAIAESPATLVDDFGVVRPTVLVAVPRIFNRIYDGLQKRMQDESRVKQMLFARALAVSRERRERRELGRPASLLLETQHKLFDRIIFSKVRERFGGRLRFCVSGGAALSREVGEFIDSVGLKVLEGYGLTETSPVVAVNRLDDNRLGTIGKPVAGVQVFICDESQKVLPPETEGEIVVVGPNIMIGYHGLPEETAAVVFDLQGQRAFRTGDMGLVTSDGYIKVTGRFKELYKLENGKYVVPTILEEEIKLSGFVSQAFIYGDDRAYNVCLMVPDFDALQKWAKQQALGELSPSALIGHPEVHAKMGEEMKAALHSAKGYERPTRWALIEEEFTVENGLLTPKLSVKRREVLKRYRSVVDGLYTAK